MLRKLAFAGWTLGILLATGLLWSPSAKAAPLCRTVAGHQICVLKITRSAKYYWEYRAVVKVDDQSRPMGRYNCRTNEYISRKGQRTSDDVAAKMICSFFKPS